jgi:prepilin-type N-terminal cleavage/methylation domain-containing protein
MIRHRHNEPPCGSRGAAFTLIEIVVALTVVAVIAAVAIPTLKGMGREERARAPVTALAALVQEVRQRATRENRAYQIVFERTGIHALADGFPAAQREEFLKALDEAITPPPGQVIERPQPSATVVETAAPAFPTPIGLATPPPAEPAAPAAPPPANDAAPAAETPGGPPPWKPPWTVSIPLPDPSECEMLFWGDAEWDRLEADDIRRWVFQPSGIASPVRLRLRTAAVEIEVSFDALTGEVIRERIDFLSPQP